MTMRRRTSPALSAPSRPVVPALLAAADPARKCPAHGMKREAESSREQEWADGPEQPASDGAAPGTIPLQEIAHAPPRASLLFCCAPAARVRPRSGPADPGAAGGHAHQ